MGEIPMKKAILYSTKSCVHCLTAKNLLAVKGYEVDYRVIGENATMEQFQADCPGAKVVPQVLIEGKVLSGINEIKAYL